jgi:hypothetical protein
MLFAAQPEGSPHATGTLARTGCARGHWGLHWPRTTCVCYRVAESRTVLEANERWDLRAETYRLQGELLLRQAALDVVQAEVCFQQAESWELRTTRGLSRSWQQRNKRDETPELLAPIYTWFTEGFDTADWQEAKALRRAVLNSIDLGHCLAAALDFGVMVVTPLLHRGRGFSL